MGACSPALTSQGGGFEYNSLANDLTNHESIESPLLLDSKLTRLKSRSVARCLKKAQKHQVLSYPKANVNDSESGGCEEASTTATVN